MVKLTENQAKLFLDKNFGAVATIRPDGTPHVMPVGMYRLDEGSDVIDTMGGQLTTTKKWRDVIRSRGIKVQQ